MFLKNLNRLTAAGLRVVEESCRNKVGREVGRRLARHMPALVLFFSYLESSVTGVLCETDTVFFFFYWLKGLHPEFSLRRDRLDSG